MNRRAWLRFSENFFRHRLRNLLPFFILVILGSVYLYLREPIYLSRGVFYLQEETLLSALTNVRSNSVSIVTPAKTTKSRFDELLQTDSFIRAIIAGSELEQELVSEKAVNEMIKTVREDVGVKIQGANQIAVLARADSPMLAYQLAKSATDGFLQWQINTSVDEGIDAESFYIDLLVRYEQELSDAQDEIEAYLAERPEPLKGKRPTLEVVQIAELEAKVKLASDRFRDAQQVTETARLARAQAERAVRQTYIVIDEPQLPRRSQNSTLQEILIFASFAFVGLILTVVATAGVTVLDNSFLYPIDLREELELPLLGSVGHTLQPAPVAHFRLQAGGVDVPAAVPQRITPKLALNDDPPTLIILPR